MRTERNKDETYNVWLSREEYRAIPRAADSFEHEIAIRSMGDCGLRVTEVLDVTPLDISRMDDGRHHLGRYVGECRETSPVCLHRISDVHDG